MIDKILKITIGILIIINFFIINYNIQYDPNEIIEKSNQKFYIEKIKNKKLNEHDRTNLYLYQFYGNTEYLKKIYYNK